MKADFDLEFLQRADNQDLLNLCDTLTYNKQGWLRFNEQLTSTEGYTLYYPDNTPKMWKDIALELQRYGGNTLANLLFRHGRGPAYEQVVYDACKFYKVSDIQEHDTAEEMEHKLLIAFFGRILGKLQDDDVKQMMEELEIKNYALTKQGATAALLFALRCNKSLFTRMVEYIACLVAEQLVGRGILASGMFVAERALGFLLGPIGWTLITAWTVVDLAGPAYRVTVPAVLQVALMRIKCSTNS